MKKIQIVAICIAAAIIILNFMFFLNSKIFFFIFGLAVVVAILPFFASFIVESGREKEKEEMFLEFARNISENVKSGMPITKSVAVLKDRDFGSLSPYIKKLANQIAIGIPFRQAFQTFAGDANNRVINRSVELIMEAETSGGEIASILEQVVNSVNETENLKKERKSKMFNMIVQGYIIFIIFIVIMLFVELSLMPMISGTIGQGGIGTVIGGGTGGGAVGGIGAKQEVFQSAFFILMLVQAFFCGLVVGKLSEGTIKAGIKHSAILLTLTYFIVTGARAIF